MATREPSFSNLGTWRKQSQPLPKLWQEEAMAGLAAAARLRAYSFSASWDKWTRSC
jgi:hypothetical protein